MEESTKPPSGGRRVSTRYRRIVSEIPHPRSTAVIEELGRREPRSMHGFSSIVWRRARGFQVSDGWGNRWIDFTSAIILANAGHANPVVGRAIRRQLRAGLWHAYCNPTEIRLRAVTRLQRILPPALGKVFFLTTGSEATECAIKLMRLHGRRIAPDKINILSFLSSFHGRTMGAQRAGGYLDQQEWMGVPPAGFHHIPFPDCGRCPWGRPEYQGCGEECLRRGLETLGPRAGGETFAGVITETFQGPTVAFMPPDYVRALRAWANSNRALLVFDEIQAGFGRTGRWWGFEHYGVAADLMCLGKGMTSSLPMSAVAGTPELLDLPDHGDMSSTHTGNPLCSAALIGNIDAIEGGGLVANAAALGERMADEVEALRREFPGRIGHANGKGLAWGIYLTRPGTRELDVESAKRVTAACIRAGLLMVQTNRGTLKIAPPLCITEAALLEGMGVIRDSLRAATAEGGGA